MSQGAQQSSQDLTPPHIYNPTQPLTSSATLGAFSILIYHIQVLDQMISKFLLNESNSLLPLFTRWLG